MIKMTIVAVVALAGSVSVFGIAGAQERTAVASSLKLSAVVETASMAESARPTVAKPCAEQAWPHVSPDCVAGASGGPVRTVRVISVR